MAKVDWSRAHTILARVLEAPEGEQDRVLVAECAGDEALLAGLRELLAQEADPTGLFGARPERLAGDSAAAGQRIGPWRLERLLGTGGMGAVWLAARADGAYDQSVALKITRAGFGTASLTARLERERALLARLEHPGIARIIDGGTTGDGAPYFALEYVDGVRIDEYADARRLSVRERVTLFVRVLQAVEYAHERGLVHRDVKPANVLVTEDGDPKLLDFGIAKLIEEDTAFALTSTGERMMTPRYASPEQIAGAPVTTAVDIYALGVVLYELLTGAWPYSSPGSSIVNVQLAICKEPARRASKSVSGGDTTRVAFEPGRDETTVAAQRATTPPELARALSGDLDWVLAKALAKEPERRYASARAFADDLRRHLAGYPVLARPDSRLYRARKFVRRNRVLVAATAAVVLSLSGALVYSLRQNRLAVDAAERSAREAARASAAEADALARLEQVRQTGREIFELAGDIALLPGSAAAQLQMVEQGLRNLDAQATDARRDPALALEVASGFLMLSEVLCSSSGVSLGRPDEAAEAIRKSLVLQDAVLAARPSDVLALAGKVSSLTRMASVRTAERRLVEARGLAQRALEVAEPHLGGGERPLRAAASEALRCLADYELRNGMPDEALRCLERSVELAGDLPDEGERCAAHHAVLGSVLRALGDHAGATRAYRAGLELLEPRLVQGEDNVRLRADVASMRAGLGRTLLDTGQVGEARALLQEALETQRRVLEVDRTNHGSYVIVLHVLKALGQAALRGGEADLAFERWDEGLDYCRQGLSRWPGDEALLVEEIVLLGLGAQTHLATGDFERAEASARRAIERVEGYLEGRPDDRDMRQNHATFRGQLGHALLQLGRLDEAQVELAAYHESSVENAERFPEEAWSRTDVLFAVDNYGGMNFELGKDELRPHAARIEYLERARELYAESVERARALVDEGLLPPGANQAIEATVRSIAECEALLAELRAQDP